MVKACNYIDAKTFGDFKENQDKLIDILNHNITKLTEQGEKTSRSNIKLSNDVQWLKKIMGIQTGILTGVFLALIGIIFKMVFGS